MVTIEVTEADIQVGQRKNCFDCPIALAVRRAYPEITNPEFNISVGVRHGFVGNARFWMPTEAAEFIKKFDAGETVEPFSFQVETY